MFEKPDSNAGLFKIYVYRFVLACRKLATFFLMCCVDFETVNQRINTYVKGASVTHHLPIAEALINRHGSDDDSSRFIPFVGVSNHRIDV